MRLTTTPVAAVLCAALLPAGLAAANAGRPVDMRGAPAAPSMTGEPVRSNEPWAGTERWLYFPSSTGWTRKTTIDLGYLDLCVTDGTKCSKPYYPSGPTPVLKPD